eukprot:6491402-Amphidinium_carterae.3
MPELIKTYCPLRQNGFPRLREGVLPLAVRCWEELVFSRAVASQLHEHTAYPCELLAVQKETLVEGTRFACYSFFCLVHDNRPHLGMIPDLQGRYDIAHLQAQCFRWPQVGHEGQSSECPHRAMTPQAQHIYESCHNRPW